MDWTPMIAATQECRGRLEPRETSAAVDQAEQDLTVGVGAGDVLEQFAGDIPGIEFWKNEDGGVARHFALRVLFGWRCPAPGPASTLQLTIKVRIQTFFVRLLLRESRRRLDFADGRMSRAAFGGIGSKATRGRVPRSCRANCAVENAISASCSTFGSGITPQSAINITPCSPKRVSSTSMMRQLEAVVACGATLMIERAAQVLRDLTAPETNHRPGAWPPSSRRSNSD